MRIILYNFHLLYTSIDYYYYIKLWLKSDLRNLEVIQKTIIKVKGNKNKRFPSDLLDEYSELLDIS